MRSTHTTLAEPVRQKLLTKSLCWQLVTCEYPPQLGGVSDYTSLLAQELNSEGDEVHVWCPGGSQKSAVNGGGITVHRDLGRMGLAEMNRLGRQLDAFPGPRNILVQWVPHGYGFRSMNLPFCLWLLHRAVVRKDRISIMVHEPHLRFREGSWKQDAVAAVHRVMDVVLLLAAKRVWTSIPLWKSELQPFALGRALPFTWLPVPSNIPVTAKPPAAEMLRKQYAGASGLLLGHFGTHNPLVVQMLEKSLPMILERVEQCSVLLIGAGSQKVAQQWTARWPALSSRIHATGALEAQQISEHLSACDLLLQPYLDGVSARRGSVMAALSHGKPVVSTSGVATERVWQETGGVAMVPMEDDGALVDLTVELLTDSERRSQLAEAGRELYESRFAIRHTVRQIRQAEGLA